MGRKLKAAAAVIAVSAAGLWIGNSNLFSPSTDDHATLLAHRGVHQTFSGENLQNDTCTAERIYPPVHNLIENTIPSMQAAFDAGASLVEFDVHPTTDGRFAVFHDWAVDCRTDGSGVTREKTMGELKKLDVGYGYTADGGATYPLRGSGVGLLPSLEEVLAAFPDKRFLIHVKSKAAAEGRMLAEHLSRLPEEQRSRLMVYGNDEPLREVKSALPGQRIAARSDLMNCLLRYAAIGWSGYVPEACRDGAMFVPSNLAPFLWGWPNRLAARLKAADSKLVILGPYSGGDFSTGIDSEAAFRDLPAAVDAIVWTNRIDLIGPLAPH